MKFYGYGSILVKVLVVFTFFATCSRNLTAQSNLLGLSVSSYGDISTGKELKPLWGYSNEWGMFDQYGQYDMLIYGRAGYGIIDKKNISLSGAVGGVFRDELSSSYLHEAFLKGKIWNTIDFSFGKEAFSPVAKDDRITTGSYLMSTNARPIPKISLGIYDYKSLKFLSRLISIKGGISQGWLNDDRGSQNNSANQVLLHEKFAYIKFGRGKFQTYMGLVHSALFGGVRPSGDNIPVDYWATFKAAGSTKIGGGEETNAAGAHMGLWDFGFYLEHAMAKLHFYLQKPFTDGSGMRLNNGRNKDFILGVLIYPQKSQWIKGVSLEIIKTDHQSGEGIPDPLYPSESNKDGIVWMQDLADYNSIEDFMKANFPNDDFGDVSDWVEDDVQAFLRQNYNHGNYYGGRDDYMNNYFYYSGWTYHNRSLGTPLYHTDEQYKRYSGQSTNSLVKFVNNRVNGWHVGFNGKINGKIDWVFKFTSTINHGSYAEKYNGDRNFWKQTENYYFEKGRKEYYSGLKVNYVLPQKTHLRLFSSVNYDFGALYHSFGGRLGLIYTPQLSF